MAKSSVRSVKYYGDSFYSLSNTIVFVPLDRNEHDLFLKKVQDEETKRGRALTTTELYAVADRLSG